MRIAIIGKGLGWWNYEKHEFDALYAINSQFFFVPECTMVFEMHDYEWTLKEVLKHIRLMSEGASEDEMANHAAVVYNLFPTKIKALNKRELPLVSVREYNFINNSIAFPKSVILDEVCHSRDFLSSTVACALAYAIYMRPKSIYLYGVSTNDGRNHQHPSIAYLSGIAEERGITINIDRSWGSTLLKSDFKYGYIETYP